MRVSRRQRVALQILTGLLAFASLAYPSAAALAAQLEPSPDDPALFDTDLAQAQLDQIDADIAALRLQIDQSLAEIDATITSRDFLSLNDVSRAETLQNARERARRMAVNAYIGTGPNRPSLALLDTQSAGDAAWRQNVIEIHAERLTEAAVLYTALAESTDDEVIALSDDIDTIRRRIERLNRDLTDTQRSRPDAVATLSIAEVHAIADQEFADRGRAEPSREQWRKLRFCESTETYSMDSGNTFYGAYQFTQDTWYTVGGDGSPADASAAEQDARARLLFSRRGAQPWPVCGRYLR